MWLFFQHWDLFREAVSVPRLLGLGAAQKPQQSCGALGVSVDCLAPPCTLGRLCAISLQWWDEGLMPLSCILPRDLSFTMEFWVSLKCSVLILPSLSSATTSSLSPSFPLGFPMSDCLLVVLPTSHLCSYLPSASAWPEFTLPSSPSMHWLTNFALLF